MIDRQIEQCVGGRTGQVVPRDGVAVTYGDLDRDGADETVAQVDCVIEGTAHNSSPLTGTPAAGSSPGGTAGRGR
jgi:hypothetical protein